MPVWQNYKTCISNVTIGTSHCVKLSLIMIYYFTLTTITSIKWVEDVNKNTI